MTILIADDEEINLRLLSELCRQLGYRCLTAVNGRQLVAEARREQPDLIVTDVVMPELDGFAALDALKNDPATSVIPAIIVTAKDSRSDRLTGIAKGASDFLTKPFDIQELSLRIDNCLKIKHYQDLLRGNAATLERQVAERTVELRQAIVDVDAAYRKVQAGYEDTVYRLTLAAEYKDGSTGEHIRRISRAAQHLAQAAGCDAEFCNTIRLAAPMHDIGKVGIPDAILMKPGPLTADEWGLMKRHTLIGSEILKGSDSPILLMAEEIARCHHERWDGGGYPAGLAGDDIPKAARIVALVDAYDAIRSQRVYKRGVDHEAALGLLTRGDDRASLGHFDPRLLDAFKRAHMDFDGIYRASGMREAVRSEPVSTWAGA